MFAQPSPVEVDARQVSWSTVRRLALMDGSFPPLYQTISEEELARYWPQRYEWNRRGLSWQTCDCKENPGVFRLQGRAMAGYQGYGDVVAGESGLGPAAGWNLSLEPRLDVSSGRWWAAVGLRWQGRMAAGGRRLETGEVGTWPGWDYPAANYQVGKARTRGDDWRIDLPHLAVGCRLDGWNLSAGWMPARTGPGISGALNLDRNSPSFPSVVARRNRPFVWSGFMKPLAPDNLLLRVGKLSRRDVYYQDEEGSQWKSDEPWFFQWLIGWNVTSWFRTSFTHSAMATARSGTLWPDLLQINFPVIGSTWREADSGPITDRIFAAQFEFRWRNSPLKFLPSAAGRAYWEYAGTDFLPSGPGGVVPQLSIPASVAGVELVEERWDLAFEYYGTYHPTALWYSNGGYREGYTQDGWLLGHAAGGGARGALAQIHWRPGRGRLQYGLKTDFTAWKHESYLPDKGQRFSLSMSVGLNPSWYGNDLLWEFVGQWSQEKYLSEADPEESLEWVRAYFTLGY